MKWKSSDIQQLYEKFIATANTLPDREGLVANLQMAAQLVEDTAYDIGWAGSPILASEFIRISHAINALSKTDDLSDTKKEDDDC